MNINVAKLISFIEEIGATKVIFENDDGYVM